LQGFARLRREKNFTPIFDRIRRAALGRAALPHLHIEGSFSRATGVGELDFQRERPTQLKHTVKTDPHLDNDVSLGWNHRQGGDQER